MNKVPAAMYYPEGTKGAKKVEKAKEKKPTMRGFIRDLLAEEGDPGKMKYTFKEVFEKTCQAFPEWPSLGRSHYPRWYYDEAKRKGEKVLEPNTPPKEKKETTNRKGMTKSEQEASLNKFIDRMLAAPAKGNVKKDKVVKPEALDAASLPEATKTKGSKKGKK